MGGGDKKDVRNEINTEQRRVQEQYDKLYSEMEQKRDDYTARSDEERNYLVDSLRGIAESGSGGLRQDVIDNIRGLYGGKNVGFEDSGSGGSGGGGGGYSGSSGNVSDVVGGSNASLFDKPEQYWQNLADTGGVDMEKLRAQIPELENMARTGAFDEGTRQQILDIANELRNFQYDPKAKESIQNTIDQLKDIARTGGYDPEALARIRNDIAGLRQWSDTGGIDPAQLQKLRDAYGFMLEGGMTPEDIERFRGTGFSEFAETGGWNPEQIAEYRNRSTSVIPALYAQQQNEAQRLAAIGGSSPAALAAAQARMARQGAQDLTTASRNAEIDLQGQIREGRRWGIEGLRDTEAMLQERLGANRTAGMSSGNQLELGVGTNRLNAMEAAMRGETTLEQNLAANRLGAGQAAGNLEIDFQNSINDAIQKSLSGAGNLLTNMESAISANRVKAQQIAAEAEARAQQLQQEGMIAGAQGLTTIAAQKAAEARAAAAQAASARAADQANERWWAQFISANERYIGDAQMQGEQNALRNLTQIYGMDPTLQRDMFQGELASDQAGANARLLGIDTQLATSGGGKGMLDWAKFGLGAADSFTGSNSNGSTDNFDWAVRSNPDIYGYMPGNTQIPGGMDPVYGEVIGDPRDRGAY